MELKCEFEFEFEFETGAIHKGQEPDPATGAVVPPIYQTTTFVQEEPGVHKGFEYSRTDNPTRRRLEETMAFLEGGGWGLCFSSGMAAISAVMALLEPGDHVIVSQDVYGGTYRLFEQVLRRYGLEFSYVDTTAFERKRESSEASIENVKRKIAAKTKMIWLETPSNPLLQISDIREIAKLKGDSWLIVDNTFATPYLQRPLELGADIVVHSTTKYLGGHCDVVGGAIVTSDERVYKELKFMQNAVGAVPSPFDCWLVQRGIKTLAIRMDKHCQNAAEIAAFLESHEKIERVFYPGLESHPQHNLATLQMKGYGGMLSFELKGDLKRFLQELKIILLAESLGGVESLICHPATMTHSSMPEQERLARGIKDNLLRLSIGIENPKDLIKDLESALRKA